MSTQIKESVQQNELLTVREVADYMRVSRVTVWRWCQQGLIPATRVGRNWRIRRDDLLQQLKAPQDPSNPDPNHLDAMSEPAEFSANDGPGSPTRVRRPGARLVRRARTRRVRARRSARVRRAAPRS